MVSMDSGLEIDNVLSVSSRLKADGLIPGDRKIKHKSPHRKPPTFRTFKPIKAISYYGDCSIFSEEELVFCLLHEESHLKYPQSRSIFAITWLIIVASTMPFFFWYSIFILKITLVIPLIFFLPVLEMFILKGIFKKRLMRDETEADYHASLLLREQYGIQKPSTVVEKALGRTVQKSIRNGLFDRFYDKILNEYPPNLKRVELVRERVDLK